MHTAKGVSSQNPRPITVVHFAHCRKMYVTFSSLLLHASVLGQPALDIFHSPSFPTLSHVSNLGPLPTLSLTLQILSVHFQAQNSSLVLACGHEGKFPKLWHSEVPPLLMIFPSSASHYPESHVLNVEHVWPLFLGECCIPQSPWLTPLSL